MSFGHTSWKLLGSLLFHHPSSKHDWQVSTGFSGSSGCLHRDVLVYVPFQLPIVFYNIVQYWLSDCYSQNMCFHLLSPVIIWFSVQLLVCLFLLLRRVISLPRSPKRETQQQWVPEGEILGKRRTKWEDRVLLTWHTPRLQLSSALPRPNVVSEYSVALSEA